MVVKLVPSLVTSSALFESSVNSYGSQTFNQINKYHCQFESSVNSYGSQTTDFPISITSLFESSVNSYGSQTQNAFQGI